MIRLIVGLGNPGTKYANTRHNLGFHAIDRLLEDSPAKSERLFHSSLLMETDKYGLLCKPLTYMNRSGRSVAAISRDFGFAAHEILVLYDDFALQLGIIRIRPHGSSGGHNGLQSIIDHLATDQIPRVRMGIKTEELIDSEQWMDFVLQEFRRSEKSAVAELLDLCSDAVSVILHEGIIEGMNRFNKKQKLV